MARFFTSDTHYSHSNILRFEPEARQFSSTAEMDRALIDNWNAVVNPEDTVYHLGDVALGPIVESLPLVDQLNGIKYLVPGNHDRVFSQESEARRARFRPAYLEFFEEILPEQVNITLSDGTEVTLCHFPYAGDSQEKDRHDDLRPFDEGRPLIHGHVHSQFKTRGRQFNVGVDVSGLRPVAESEIVDWIKTLGLESER